MIDQLFDNFRHTSRNNFNYLTNISQKYKIVYFEIPKTGCSTIKKTLQYIESDGQAIKKEQIHNKVNSPLKGIFDFDSKISENILSSDDWFKFVFIRNPYERVLSAYLDKIVTNQWEKKRRVGGLGFTFEDEISFLDFLEAISRQNPLDMDIHWRPQTYMLPLNFNEFDYIGRFENFATHWNEVLILLQNRVQGEDKRLFTSQDVVFHKTDAKNKINKYYGEKEKRIVQSLYEVDFDVLNYGYI